MVPSGPPVFPLKGHYDRTIVSIAPPIEFVVEGIDFKGVLDDVVAPLSFEGPGGTLIQNVALDEGGSDDDDSQAGILEDHVVEDVVSDEPAADPSEKRAA